MQNFMAGSRRTLILGFACAVFVLLAQSSARADCIVAIGGNTVGTFLRNNTVINPTQLGLGFQGTNFNTVLTNPGATSAVNLGGLNLAPGALLGGLSGLGLQTGDTLRLLTNVSVNGGALQPLMLVGTVGAGVNGSPSIIFAPVTTTCVVDAAANVCTTFTVAADSLNLLDPVALLNGIHGNVTLNACGNCGAAAATPTPEPATMALFGTGLVGFAANRRRRRKAQADEHGDVAG